MFVSILCYYFHLWYCYIIVIVNIYIICLIYIITILMCCGVNICVDCYLLMCLVCWNPQQIAKKEVRYELYSLSYFTLWYEWVNIRAYVFLSPMHVLNFMFWMYVTCIHYEIGIVNGSGLLFYDLPKKGFRENFGSILDFLGIPSESGF